MYTGRACYLQTWPGNDTYELDHPIFGEDLPSQSPIGYEKKEMTLDDIFEELTIVEETFPDIPPFEALRLYFTSPLEVCPTAMMDPYLVFLIEAEQAAREYNVLPYDGGLWDQPRALLNIFSAIRTERNHYERIRFEKIDRKMKSKGAIGPRKAGDILQSPNTNLPPASRNK